jgi:hypothetical protein
MIAQLRDFLMDHDRFNEIIKGQEHSDQQLGKMLIQAVLHFNATPPYGQELNIESWENILQEQWILILDLAAARALISVTNKLMRNHMSYQDGSINKQVNERWQYYERQISRLLGGQTGSDGASVRIKEFKTFLNANNCMGASHTELLRWTMPFTSDYLEVHY